ncbi:MAG: ROK family protein, partial [Bacteroidota bacterium]
MQAVISIDIGGTSTKLATVDQVSNVLDEMVFATQSYQDEDAYFDRLFLAVSDLIARRKEDQILGIGIGAPCGIPNEGVIYQAANLPFSERVEIVRRFEEVFAIPTFLTKDSYAAALGEGVIGAAQNMSDYIVITLGTGLGSALVANQQLIIGSNGQAGELGHTTSVPGGRACRCGKRGCLETYVSASGIKRTLFELLANSNRESFFRKKSFDEVSAKDIFLQAQNGDELALKAFELTGKLLGEKLADLVALTEPEAIVINGGLASSGTLLIKPVQEHLEKNLLRFYQGKIKILI